MKALIHKALSHPLLYRIVQSVIAPGAMKNILRNVNEILGELPPAKLIVDIGCGPTSLLTRFDLHPVGVDLSLSYVQAYTDEIGGAVVASADALPFPSQSVDGVWSIGLLHHLPDPVARATIDEFLRICKSPGHIVILDGVLPEPAWKRPLAALVRRFDRGEFMRRQDQLEALLPSRTDWSISRFTYSITGLEMLALRHVRG